MRPKPGIGLVTEADLARLIEVWEASVRATHHFLSESDIAFLRPLVGHGLLKLERLVCVRGANGQVTAFAGISEHKLEALFIDPAGRGTGIGRNLLRYAVDNLGVTTVDVNEQNEQAVGFYLHMGFVTEGRSETDGLGKPFPLLHMRLRPRS
ncbi:MAG: acetyltransferase [Acidobacteriota bacterium]